MIAAMSFARRSCTVSGWSAGLVGLLTVILIAVSLVSAVPAHGPVPSTLLDERALFQTAGQPIEAVAAPESIDELRARVAVILEREQVPGVGLALVDREGLIWAGGVGVADLDTQKPVTADTVFRVASITKSVVALGVMRLVEQGRLSLDEPLHERMPEIEMHNRWADTDPINLAHALEHTAGFDEMRFNEWHGEEGLSPRDALSINPRSRVSRWRPGTRTSYSNEGYTIAGYAIELATGEPWDRYLEREVLRPLGMHTARFRRTPELVERLATGHAAPARAATFEPFAHAPAGALLSSPRELAGLVHFWLRRGQIEAPILGAASLDRIEQTRTLPYRGTDSDHGLGNYGDVRHPVRSRGHDGGVEGFFSSYRYFPELGVGYVVLLNASHSGTAQIDIRALVFAYLTRGRQLPTPPTAPRDDEAIAEAAGFYAHMNPRVELFGFIERALLGVDVRPSEQGVELELVAGGRVDMVPTGDGGFRHPSEGGTSVRATRNAEGERILIVGGLGGYFETGSGTWARARLRTLQAALVLMPLAMVWGLGWMLIAGVGRLRGRSPVPEQRRLQVRPAVAALSFMAIPMLMFNVFERGAFGGANAWSIALCGATLLFPACSAAASVTVLRSRALGSFWVRAVPSAAAFACFGMAVYLALNGFVGLRIWAW
jgi:CubicO group peptidase (beta-lactamase class C family)